MPRLHNANCITNKSTNIGSEEIIFCRFMLSKQVTGIKFVDFKSTQMRPLNYNELRRFELCGVILVD